MTRPLRIQYPGAVYHVTNRGNEQKDIFKDDVDRAQFLEILAKSIETYDIRLHSFVMMSNHFHLLVETPLGNLGDFMRHFNITYTSHFNRRHQRTGHLYQGRYKSLLIDQDNYFSKVSRYIHLNPVRISSMKNKKIEDQLDYLWQYKWSSLPGFIKLKARYSMISYEYMLEEYGGDSLSGRRAYKNILSEDLQRGLSIKDKIIGQSILGEDDFVSWVKEEFLEEVKDRERPAIGEIHSLTSKDVILRVASKRLKIKPAEIRTAKGKERYILMYLLYRFGGLKNKDIGDFFGVDYSTVSQGRKRLYDLKTKNKKTKELLNRIEEDLSFIKI